MAGLRVGLLGAVTGGCLYLLNAMPDAGERGAYLASLAHGSGSGKAAPLPLLSTTLHRQPAGEYGERAAARLRHFQRE